MCKNYTSSLSLANRGRVIAAINQRPPSNRLSKLLSILKQNAFPRFIIAGPALTFLLLSFIAVWPPPSTPHRDLPSFSLMLPPSVIVNDVVDNGRASGNLIVRVRNILKRVSSNEIDLRTATDVPSPKTEGTN